MIHDMTDAMIDPEATNSTPAETEADVRGYYDVLTAISSVMGGIGTTSSLLQPTHIATPAYTSGGSTGGSSGQTTRLN